MARSGTGSTGPVASTGTSKTYPWGLSKPDPVPHKVSSHDSQLPHGVGPPAQLTIVPASDTNSSTSSTASSPSCIEILTSSDVVPPLARLS